MAKFNAEVLRWARETAGLGEADAAKKLGISAARGLEPEERLQLLENGQADLRRQSAEFGAGRTRVSGGATAMALQSGIACNGR